MAWCVRKDETFFKFTIPRDSAGKMTGFQALKSDELSFRVRNCLT